MMINAMGGNGWNVGGLANMFDGGGSDAGNRGDGGGECWNWRGK